MAQAASPPHRMLSSTAVLARWTNCLSTRWAMAALIKSPPTRCVDVTPHLAIQPVPPMAIRVATRAGLDHAFTRGLYVGGDRWARGESRAVDCLADQIGKAHEREEREEEQREQDHRNTFRDLRYVRQAERARDQRDDEKDDRIFEHAHLRPPQSGMVNHRCALSFPRPLVHHPVCMARRPTRTVRRPPP